MRIVLDTNVLVSGIFYAGAPHSLLKAWCTGTVDVVVSPEIITEYRRVVERLSTRLESTESRSILRLLLARARVVDAQPLQTQVCEDPHDDKFIACALAGRTD